MKKYIHPTFKQVWLLPLILLSLTAFESQSATSRVTTTISQLLITEGTFGNCMIKLNISPKSKLPNCRDDWVSFSCDGTYTSKDAAYRMMEMAQMAAILEKEVTIYIDDSRRHNTFCLATRVDLIP